MSRILVSGARGFLGRHLLPLLGDRYGADNVIGVGRDDYDLTSASEFDRMLTELQPDTLIHLAAYVGGIGVGPSGSSGHREDGHHPWGNTGKFRAVRPFASTYKQKARIRLLHSTPVFFVLLCLSSRASLRGS